MKANRIKTTTITLAVILFLAITNTYGQENTNKNTSINQNTSSKVSDLGRILESTSTSTTAVDVQTVKELFPEAIITIEQRYRTGKNQYRYRPVEKVSMEKLVPALAVAIHQQEERLKNLEAAVNN